MKKLSLIIATLCTATMINAQNKLTNDTSWYSKDLSEVVVTGQYKPQTVKKSVYQVRIINSERIKLSGATTVQQVLNNQVGFRFSNDNTLGTTDVQLMGMSGRNVKILLDGVPMVDRGDTRESLNQVDINSIERIEIEEQGRRGDVGAAHRRRAVRQLHRARRGALRRAFGRAEDRAARAGRRSRSPGRHAPKPRRRG